MATGGQFGDARVRLERRVERPRRAVSWLTTWRTLFGTRVHLAAAMRCVQVVLSRGSDAHTGSATFEDVRQRQGFCGRAVL